MNSVSRTQWRARRFAVGMGAVWLASIAINASGQEIKVVLSGAQEIPPVATPGLGNRHDHRQRGPIAGRQRDDQRECR